MTPPGGRHTRGETACQPKAEVRARGSRAEAGLPVRAAQPLRPVRPPSIIAVPGACPRLCVSFAIASRTARDGRPFVGMPGASRLLGGRCRAAFTKGQCRAQTFVLDDRPGLHGLDLVEHTER